MCCWWLLERFIKDFSVPTAERNLCSVFWSFCFLYLLLVSSVSSSSTPHAFCSSSGWPKIFFFFFFHPSTSCLFVFSPNKESPVWHVRKKVPRLQTTLDHFWNCKWKCQDVTDRVITPDGSKLGKWVGEYLQLCALCQGWYKCTYCGMQLNVCAQVCAWGIVGKKLAWPEVSGLVLLVSIKTLLDE